MRRLAKLVMSPRSARKDGRGSSSASQPPWPDVIKCTPDAIPAELAERLTTDLQRLRSHDEVLFGGRRDSVWTDIIDPELCLTEDERWQTCEVDVSREGCVHWLSWVNHLEERVHASLLGGLAELLAVAIPSLEGLRNKCERLRNRQLQFVVGAFEHALAPPASEPSASQTPSETPIMHNISDWHVDGEEEERIIATAICYLDIQCHEGGELEFQHRNELWVDDPAGGTHRAKPASRMLVAFDNEALRHRVLTVRGGGRRLLVVFHLVDPHAPTTPHASGLPRQLRSQRVSESAHALSGALLGRSDLQRAGIVLPPELIERICELAADLDGALSLDEVLRRRDARRRARLAPGRDGDNRGTGHIQWGTGVSQPSDDETSNDEPEDVLTGLGPASAAWLS